MTRFLMLLAAAAVAGAMYVAAAPGSQTRSGPTAAQFKALSRKVTTLQKQLTATKKLTTEEAVVLVGCLLYTTAPISQYGAVTSGSTGYVYGVPSNTSTFGSTTALDLTHSGGTAAFSVLGVNPECAPDIKPSSSGAASHLGGALQHLAQLRH
jgi:hypothetical protein